MFVEIPVIHFDGLFRFFISPGSWSMMFNVRNCTNRFFGVFLIILVHSTNDLSISEDIVQSLVLSSKRLQKRVQIAAFMFQ